MGRGRSRRDLRWWERTWLAVFGVFVACSNPDPTWFGVVLAVVGVAIVLAAIGVVDVLMALYYRQAVQDALGRLSRPETADGGREGRSTPRC